MTTSTNLFGIHTKAIEFLEKNSIKTKIVSKCKKFSSLKPKSEFLLDKKGKPIYYGLFNDYCLNRYSLNNGFAIEFVQNQNYWIKGPLIFLGLSIKTFQEKIDIVWPEEEIISKVESLE